MLPLLVDDYKTTLSDGLSGMRCNVPLHNVVTIYCQPPVVPLLHHLYRCLHFSRTDDIFMRNSHIMLVYSCYCYPSRQLGGYSETCFCPSGHSAVLVSVLWLYQLHFAKATLLLNQLHYTSSFLRVEKAKTFNAVCKFLALCIILITNGTHTHTRMRVNKFLLCSVCLRTRTIYSL